MEFNKDLINSILKISLNDEEFNPAIDFLTNDMHRNDFKLRGENKIVFYYEIYFIISIDTLNDFKIDINTNLIQSRNYQILTGQKFDSLRQRLKIIPYENNFNLVMKSLRKEKLKKISGI